MKKIALILAFVLPVLAFGQAVQNIAVSKEMKTIDVALSVNYEKIYTTPLCSEKLLELLTQRPGSTQPVYEATVLDAGFEAFLATQHPIQFYSESTLKSKNTQMVSEWNSRHLQPTRYNSDIYEVNIDYDPFIDYGLDVEYTLYMFFKFMEKEHKIKLS